MSDISATLVNLPGRYVPHQAVVSPSALLGPSVAIYGKSVSAAAQQEKKLMKNQLLCDKVF